MQCTIYAPDELRKKRRIPREGMIVLARKGKALILCGDEIHALWTLPQGMPMRGESAQETARRVLGEGIGESVFDVSLLCGYTVTGEDGKESGGMAYLADVTEWPAEQTGHARAFEQMPPASQMAQPALVMALHRWAGAFFDARLDVERLGAPL